MLQQNNPEDSSGERRRILLIGAEPSQEALISTFLVTMGCTCATVSSREMSAVIERETFDAVLLALDRSQVYAEKTILRIKEIRPSLAERTLVITSSFTDRQTIELIERHDLQQVSQGALLGQLWSALQGMFAGPRLPKLAPQNMQIAQVIFDSFRSPLPAGVRGLHAPARQLAYQHKSATIDLIIEPREGRGGISISGQVLDATKRKGEGLAVLLTSDLKTLARTTTNQFGEFGLEFELAKEACLEIRLGEGVWVSLPLGKMDWVKKRMTIDPCKPNRGET